MAQFPVRETESLGFGVSTITGLSNNVAIYPAPPLTSADLSATFDTAIAAQAAALQATTDKELVFQSLTNEMEETLCDAKSTIAIDDEKLKSLGGGGRKASTARHGGAVATGT